MMIQVTKFNYYEAIKDYLRESPYERQVQTIGGGDGIRLQIHDNGEEEFFMMLSNGKELSLKNLEDYTEHGHSYDANYAFARFYNVGNYQGVETLSGHYFMLNVYLGKMLIKQLFYREKDKAIASARKQLEMDCRSKTDEGKAAIAEHMKEFEEKNETAYNVRLKMEECLFL